MSLFNSSSRTALWCLAIACLIAAALTWWWFEMKIETIDTKIETMYKQ